MGLIIVVLLAISVLSETTTPCVDDDTVIFYREFDSVKYCYKFLAHNKSDFTSTDNDCKAWKDGARMNSIHSDEEWDHHKYILDKYPSEFFWVGLITNTYLGGGVQPERCEECVDHSWMDKSNDDCVAGQWLNDNIASLLIECSESQQWCYYHRSNPITGPLDTEEPWSLEATGGAYMWQDMYCDETGLNGICKYKFKKCGAYWEDEVGVCNDRGVCVQDDLCSCEFMYEGDLCETTHKCMGIRQDDPLVCNSNGNCTSEDTCECLEGYFGDHCNMTTSMFSDCDGVSEEIFETSCYVKFPPGLNVFEAQDDCEAWGGNLVAINGISEETFLREKFGYFMVGLLKDPLNLDEPPHKMWPCSELSKGFIHLDYETPDTYPVAKGNRIKCEGYNFCFGVDDDFFWTERDCEESGDIGHVCKRRISQCSGVLANDPTQCNERGYCEGESCVCYNGYEGTDCGTYRCFGVLHDFKSVTVSPCSGHGDCVGPNSCICENDYGGVDCSATFCDGIISTRSDVCHGHGDCVAYDECKCHEDYGGDNCLSPYPIDTYIDTDYGALRRILWDGPAKECADPLIKEHEYANLIECRVSDFDYTSPPPASITSSRTWIYQHEVNNKDVKPMSQYEAEDYATEVWYPGKGRLMPIKHEMNRHFSRALRWKDARTLRDFDVWLAVRKLYGNKIDPDLLSRDTGDPNYYIGIYNYPYQDVDHPDNVYFRDNAVFTNTQPHGIFFSTPTYCFRQLGRAWAGSWSIMGDMECEAPINWVVSYELHWCDGIEEDQTDTVCNGNGFCWEDDVCTCKGNRGYVMPWCETRWCNDVESNQDEVCSGNGDCVEIPGEPYFGKCSCADNWYGSDCDITVCDGIFTNDTGTEGGLVTTVCSGHGVCYAPDKCFCGEIVDEEYISSDKYFGADCSTTYCNYISSLDNETVCNGHGSCYPYDVCTCISTEDEVFTGQFCEVYECFGESSTDFATVCNGGGDCVDIDTCHCIPDQYYGERCEITVCYDRLSNDSEVCSGKGNCTSYGVCSCDDENSFGNCSISSCWGIYGNLPEVCSGHGDCVGYNNCSCTDPLYVGEACSTTTCWGVSGDSDDVCWGRGRCVATDKCVCDEYHYGVECANFTCGGVYDNQTDLVCFSRGDCVGPDTCSCTEEGYDERTYCEYFTCYGIGSQDVSEVCNEGEGSCAAHDDCDCVSNPNYFGRECQERILSTLEVESLYDFIGQRRLVHLPYRNLVQELDGEKFPCYPDIISSVTRSGDTDFWFGEGPLCEFGDEYIIVELDDDAAYLSDEHTYLIEIKLQTTPTRGPDVYVYSFEPEESEDDMDDFDPGFLDNNDEGEVLDDEKDEDDEDEDEVDDETEEDDDGLSSSTMTGIIVGASSGSAVIILLIICYCCVLGGGCLCLVLCCCGCVVFRVAKSMAKDDDDDEMGTNELFEFSRVSTIN